MQTSDEKQFENYLRGFSPVEPAALPARRAADASGPLRRAMWLAGVAAMLVAGVFVARERNRAINVPAAPVGVVSAQKSVQAVPLTMRSANAWLARAPTIKAAVNDLAFREQVKPTQQGRQSAVAVLSKEKIKL